MRAFACLMLLVALLGMPPGQAKRALTKKQHVPDATTKRGLQQPIPIDDGEEMGMNAASLVAEHPELLLQQPIPFYGEEGLGMNAAPNVAAVPTTDAADAAAIAANVLSQVASSDHVQASEAAPIAQNIAGEAGPLVDMAGTTTATATTSATPALDSGIGAASSSSNTGLSIAGHIGQMATQSDLIDTAATSATPAFDSAINAASPPNTEDNGLTQVGGDNACWVNDADELTSAIEEQDCPVVVLNNGDPDAYALDRDIQVNRAVRVMGNPAVLPQIDGSGAVRSFTVGPGGFLELQFVRIRQGGGQTRDRSGHEGLNLDSQVTEIRGGAVAVELGALGANFVGVVFIAMATSLESMQNTIEATLTLRGGRVYGGHVFVAAGSVNFFGCKFWDSTLLLPFTDKVSIGGDVLVVGGNAFFTGCIFTSTVIFGNSSGAGRNVAVLGGNAIFTFCVTQAQGLAEAANGAGQVLFVGGGTMIMTGMDLRFAAPVLLFTGVGGNFFVGDGVMVVTGVTIENSYPILAAYGAGFYLAVGRGVLVETGVTYVQFNSAAYQGLTGGSIFVGDGTSVHTGVHASFYGTTVLFTGQGGFSYNGAGYSMWFGCPLSIFAVTSVFFGVGGLTSQPAGFMVYISSPTFTPAALSYFAGLGVVMQLGAGGAVIGGSPVYAPAFSFYSHPVGTANYYVAGNQDAPNNSIGYYDKDATANVVPEEKAEKGKSVRLLSHNKTRTFDGEVHNLRQQRRLSAASINKLAFEFFDEDPMSAYRFLGVGMGVQSSIDLNDNAVVEQLKSWVPQGILDGAWAVNKLQAQFGMEPNKRKNCPLLSMDSKDVDFCALCGEGTVTGVGSNQCDVASSCDALREVQPVGTEAAFDMGEVQFDPLYLVMAEFNPTTLMGQHIIPHAFRDGLKSFFIGNETIGARVSVYSNTPDELFKIYLPDAPVSGLVNNKFPTSTPLKAVFLFNDAQQAADLKAALDDPTSDEYENMELFMQDHLSLHDVSMGAIDGKVEKTSFVPAYNSPEFSSAFKEQTDAAAGSNSVRVIDPAHEGLPLNYAVPGETYSVQMANFPANVALTVQVIGSQEKVQPDGSILAILEIIDPALAEAVETDAKGMATVNWRVPANLPTGMFYIKAVDATGTNFGASIAAEIEKLPAAINTDTAAGTAATTISTTPALDSAIDAVSSSSDTGVNIAGQVDEMAEQSGLTPTDEVPELAAADNVAEELGNSTGAVNEVGATMSLPDINDTGTPLLPSPPVEAEDSEPIPMIVGSIIQCKDSINGLEDSIASSFLVLRTEIMRSDPITGAAAFGSTLFSTYVGSPTQLTALDQLFCIYLDQSATLAKALSNIQEEAYAYLTPQCSALFHDILLDYSGQMEGGKVNSLMAAGDRSIFCSDQQSNGQTVDYNLCVWPTRDWSNNGKVYSNITATFTNYGIPLCRLAFYITNFGDNIHVSPSWLPDTSKAYPEGIPQGTEIIIEATVPWTNTIAMKGAAVIDVQGGWTTCSEEIALSESKNVPATSAASGGIRKMSWTVTILTWALLLLRKN